MTDKPKPLKIAEWPSARLYLREWIEYAEGLEQKVERLEFQLRAADADYQERIKGLEAANKWLNDNARSMTQAERAAADELADAVEAEYLHARNDVQPALTAYRQASDNRASDACADCGATGVNLMTVTSGQSNKPETTTRFVCERCWGPLPKQGVAEQCEWLIAEEPGVFKRLEEKGCPYCHGTGHHFVQALNQPGMIRRKCRPCDGSGKRKGER